MVLTVTHAVRVRRAAKYVSQSGFRLADARGTANDRDCRRLVERLIKKVKFSGTPAERRRRGRKLTRNRFRRAHNRRGLATAQHNLVCVCQHGAWFSPQLGRELCADAGVRGERFGGPPLAV